MLMQLVVEYFYVLYAGILEAALACYQLSFNRVVVFLMSS